ncbi:hypothetical protein ACO0QE_003205 [Hanseniaspora vineae]
MKRKRVEVEIEQGTTAIEDEVKLKYEAHVQKIKFLPTTEYLKMMTRELTLMEPLDLLLQQDPEKAAKLPKNFIPIYSKIREMRKTVSAAVDAQGCASMPFYLNFKLPHEPIWPTPENFRLQVLVSLMLSSQTKDEMNCKAMSQLMIYCLDNLDSVHGISFKSLSAIDEHTLDTLIQPVGFHTRKAKYVKTAVETIISQHATASLSDQDSPLDVPYHYNDIIALQGVGPKMANLLIQCAWAYGEHGIGVDVHVDRLSRMFGWVPGPKERKNPEETRVALEKMLPVSLWTEINSVLVGFGQSICIPRRQKCNECFANDICPGRIRPKIDKTYSSYEEWFSQTKNVLPIRTVEGEIEDMVDFVKKGIKGEENHASFGVKLEPVPFKFSSDEHAVEKKLTTSKYFNKKKKPTP